MSAKLHHRGIGQRGGIWTHNLMYPKHAEYQIILHADGRKRKTFSAYDYS